MDALLGIDLGTTRCKAAVCSPDGALLGESTVGCPLIKPGPGIVEQDATLWWDLTQQVVRQAVDAAQMGSDFVRALSVSSQGISFVPVDERGEPLGNAINWLDTRATLQAESILSRFSEEELFRLSGKRASPAYVLPKLLWLAANQPDVYRRAHKFLMAHDYLMFKLTGLFVTDHSMASGSLLHDITGLDWRSELTEAFGVAVEQLPEIRWAGTCLGHLKPEAAEALGVSDQVVVAVGGQDQKCAALGASIRSGAVTISLGTASAITCLTSRPLLDDQRRIPVFPFLVPGHWDLEGVVGTAAGALHWLRETFFPGQSYEELDTLARESPPGAMGVCFYPHLGGATSPHWRAGVRGAFLGLSLAAGSRDIVRSVLEGVAFQIRSNIEVIEALGMPVEEVILFGGGARSSLWPQLICNITGKPATCTSMVDVANWGACLLAGAAAGLFGKDLLDRPPCKGISTHWEPQPEAAAKYADICAHYRLLESKLLEREE